ncbi:MAG: RimK family alpha-L-glutamate ligase [Patescibacteria group bacterium]
MRIAVLTFTNYEKLGANADAKISGEMLREAALSRGHKFEMISAMDCQLEFIKTPRLLYKNKPLRGFDAIIVRPSFRGTELDLHVSTIHQFEFLGIPVLNNHISVMRSKNKIRTMQVLKRFGIPMPKTLVIRASKYIEEVMKVVGSYPVVIKAFGGNEGIGVAIVESRRGLRSIVDMLVESENSSPLIIQEYVKESSGKDIRIFVVGDKVVAAMERNTIIRDEFRSNFSLGGTVREATLTAKEKALAIKAAKACDLDIAGVDLLRTKSGPKILEVNSNPGLRGITQATGKDIAGAIIDYAVACAKARRKPKV